MRGVTMRSIMSDSTVKVGTTMKSINPGDQIRHGLCCRCDVKYHMFLDVKNRTINEKTEVTLSTIIM